jgi:acyl-CoA thioester hydrolase
MKPENLSAIVDIEVPFHDVDMMTIVWHGHYCKYFEIARCALLTKFNYNYPQMLESGYGWPIVDLRIRYVKPAYFGQTISVQATLVEWENRLKIEYSISDKLSGKKLTKGHSIQVAIDMSTQQMCFESPKILFDKLGLS